MLSSSTTRLDVRLESLENGVSQLDTKFCQLDDKVTQHMLMSSEMMIENKQSFRDVHAALETSRDEIQKSIRTIKTQYTSRCQLYAFGTGLSAWTLFVAYVLWS
jgi:hypothetical protein